MITQSQLDQYLGQRAARHGVDPSDLLDQIPEHLHDCPAETWVYLKSRDYSHVKPQLTHPELADDPDNFVFERGGPNSARGAEIITDAELDAIAADNADSAEIIETLVDCDSPLELLETVIDLVA